MKRIAVVLSLGVCSISARGVAQPRATKSPSHAKSIAPLPLAKQEARTYTKIVAVADADGNAHVSEVELEAVVTREVSKQARARFQRLDRDRDGRVVRTEVPTMLTARFLRFDQNSDGAFTVAELTSVLQAQALERSRAAFARLDRDGDGMLSFADAAAEPTVVAKK